MNLIQKIILLIIFEIGVISPFFPNFVILEVFYLLIPFGIIFLITLIYLTFSFLNEYLSFRNGLFIFSIIPLFLLSQITSVIFVDRIQRIRSNRIISEIENIKIKTGFYPENHYLTTGIKYYKVEGEESFVIEYSRGFMVTEKYRSKNNHWRSYGWND